MRLAVAQFQPVDGDKEYNLSVMESLIRQGAEADAQVISFHEMCITAYTYTKDLSIDEIRNLAEVVPEGKSSQTLIALARKYNIVILAGLVEREILQNLQYIHMCG